MFRPLQRQNAMRPRRSEDHYVSSVSSMSLWQSDDSISNLPPSYEDVDQPPPHYEEVMRIHRPFYQNQQPAVPPIAESLALSASQQPAKTQIIDIDTNNSVSRAHAESGDNHYCTLENVYMN
ncbi:unnamed protein product [Arctia plantaginis]|uniref:Uncharacterized protein n=1 Tax=Arctia plantaginis TaxID=874455 RepID=A0A8S0Z1T8_ARCPL|nr:unnamed protein product [Arctia plantaginis]